MPAFDWFYLIYGFGFLAVLLGLIVLVLWKAWFDAELEEIAEARGDYSPWGEGNNA